MPCLFAILLAIVVLVVDAASTDKQVPLEEDGSCQQRFPFDRRDCNRPGATCCPGPFGPTECGTVTKSGLGKGRQLKNPVCCLPVGSLCAKNKRYDACCHPLECQEENGKKKCIPVKESAIVTDDMTGGPAAAAEVEED